MLRPGAGPEGSQAAEGRLPGAGQTDAGKNVQKHVARGAPWSASAWHPGMALSATPFSSMSDPNSSPAIRARRSDSRNTSRRIPAVAARTALRIRFRSPAAASWIGCRWNSDCVGQVDRRAVAELLETSASASTPAPPFTGPSSACPSKFNQDETVCLID